MGFYCNSKRFMEVNSVSSESELEKKQNRFFFSTKCLYVEIEWVFCFWIYFLESSIAYIQVSFSMNLSFVGIKNSSFKNFKWIEVAQVQKAKMWGTKFWLNSREPKDEQTIPDQAKPTSSQWCYTLLVMWLVAALWSIKSVTLILVIFLWLV